MKTRNYRQAKRQKEEARKTRQLSKQQRRLSQGTAPRDAAAIDSPTQRDTPADPTLESDS